MTTCAQNSPTASSPTQSENESLQKALRDPVLPSSLQLFSSHPPPCSPSLGCVYMNLLTVPRTCHLLPQDLCTCCPCPEGSSPRYPLCKMLTSDSTLLPYPRPARHSPSSFSCLMSSRRLILRIVFVSPN